MNIGLVSVVVPVYNASRFLSRTINSVLAQTYQNFEIIIVDDCSTDDSLSIAQNFAKQDSRIQLLHNPKNIGVAETRNRGINEAKGEYIAFLDSDDVWLPQKLERQMALAKRTDADIVYCSYEFIDENDKRLRRPFVVPERTDYSQMLSSSVIGCSAAMIKTETLSDYRFDSAYYHEDYVLWMQLLRMPLTAVGEREVLSQYRQVVGSRSYAKLFSARKRWEVYRKVLHEGRIRSAFFFLRYAVNGVVKYYF